MFYIMEIKFSVYSSHLMNFYCSKNVHIQADGQTNTAIYVPSWHSQLFIPVYVVHMNWKQTCTELKVKFGNYCNNILSVLIYKILRCFTIYGLIPPPLVGTSEDISRRTAGPDSSAVMLREMAGGRNRLATWAQCKKMRRYRNTDTRAVQFEN